MNSRHQLTESEFIEFTKELQIGDGNIKFGELKDYTYSSYSSISLKRNGAFKNLSIVVKNLNSGFNPPKKTEIDGKECYSKARCSFFINTEKPKVEESEDAFEISKEEEEKIAHKIELCKAFVRLNSYVSAAVEKEYPKKILRSFVQTAIIVKEKGKKDVEKAIDTPLGWFILNGVASKNSKYSDLYKGKVCVIENDGINTKRINMESPSFEKIALKWPFRADVAGVLNLDNLNVMKSDVQLTMSVNPFSIFVISPNMRGNNKNDEELMNEMEEATRQKGQNVSEVKEEKEEVVEKKEEEEEKDKINDTSDISSHY